MKQRSQRPAWAAVAAIALAAPALSLAGGPAVEGAVVLHTPEAPDPRIDELAGLLADEMLRFSERLSLVPRPTPASEDRASAAEQRCRERARAVVSVDLRQTEARLTVLVCSTDEVLERWAPYAPDDPDRAVTLAHLTAALLRAGLSSGPPQLGQEDHIEPPPEPLPEDIPGARVAPARDRSTRRPERDAADREPAPGEAGEGAAQQKSQEPIAPSSVEFDAHFSTGNLSLGDAVVGGGVGAAIPILDWLAIRLDLTVYSAVTGEKSTHFAELYSVPLILGLCVRPSLDRFRFRVCAEATLNMASIRTGPLKDSEGTRRYDLKLNPGLGGGAGARFYFLPYVYTELYLSARYYLTAQRYTVDGATLISIPRHDLEARAGVGVTF